MNLFSRVLVSFAIMNIDIYRIAAEEVGSLIFLTYILYYYRYLPLMSEAYLETSQTYTRELFCEIVNGF